MLQYTHLRLRRSLPWPPCRHCNRLLHAVSRKPALTRRRDGGKLFRNRSLKTRTHHARSYVGTVCPRCRSQNRCTAAEFQRTGLLRTDRLPTLPLNYYTGLLKTLVCRRLETVLFVSGVHFRPRFFVPVGPPGPRMSFPYCFTRARFQRATRVFDPGPERTTNDNSNGNDAKG